MFSGLHLLMKQGEWHAGSGALPEAMVPVVKAQMLAFIIYTTPSMVQQQVQGVGQAQAQAEDGSEAERCEPDLEHMLPGPCPVLRRLVTFDPGWSPHHPSPTGNTCCSHCAHQQCLA